MATETYHQGGNILRPRPFANYVPRFVTLSLFVPAQKDPTECAYKTMVKYGKLGERKTFCGNPFKKPLISPKVNRQALTLRGIETVSFLGGRQSCPARTSPSGPTNPGLRERINAV